MRFRQSNGPSLSTDAKQLSLMKTPAGPPNGRRHERSLSPGSSVISGTTQQAAASVFRGGGNGASPSSSPSCSHPQRLTEVWPSAAEQTLSGSAFFVHLDSRKGGQQQRKAHESHTAAQQSICRRGRLRGCSRREQMPRRDTWSGGASVILRQELAKQHIDIPISSSISLQGGEHSRRGGPSA